RAGTLLDDRDGSTDPAKGLEVSEQDHRIGEGGNGPWRLHVSHESVLCHGKERRSALTVQILQQLVDMQDQSILVWHGCLVAIEAVDQHRRGAQAVDGLATAIRNLSR